jgi:hypothetical protein
LSGFREQRSKVVELESAQPPEGVEINRGNAPGAAKDNTSSFAQMFKVSSSVRGTARIVERRPLSCNGYNFYVFICFKLSIALNIIIRQIQSFLNVAALGSFTRAAGKMHTIQRALSQQIRDLETNSASACSTAPRAG